MSTSGGATGEVPTSGGTGDSTAGPTGPTTGSATTMGPGTGPSTGTDTGSEGSTGPGATTGSFGCTEVLYVAGSEMIGAHDQPFYDELTKLGANLTVVADELSVTADANGMCLVVISATCSSTNVTDKFRDVPVPIVTWEYAIYDEMGMTGVTVGTDLGAADPAETIEIVDPGHPMAAGLSGTFPVVEPAPGRLGWGDPAPSADVVAIIPAEASRATLFAYDAGDMMVGLVAPAARVGFPPLTAPSGATINADGRALFEAALWWAVP